MSDFASIDFLTDSDHFSTTSDPHSVEKPTGWCLATFSGRFSELSGDPASSSLSLIMRLVLEAQKQNEPAVWITCRSSIFFPPDVADNGVDLSALAVVQANNTIAAARAAEHLLRSAAFGLLVLDFGAEARLPLAVQTRLAGQARRNEAALVCLTEKPEKLASIGSLVSLRAHAHGHRRQGRHFRCQARIIKDKRQGPGWSHVEVYRGPDGLC